MIAFSFLSSPAPSTRRKPTEYVCMAFDAVMVSVLVVLSAPPHFAVTVPPLSLSPPLMVRVASVQAAAA